MYLSAPGRVSCNVYAAAAHLTILAQNPIKWKEGNHKKYLERFLHFGYNISSWNTFDQEMNERE